MNKLLDGLKEETTKTYTENGALTFSSSLNNNVDFFFLAPAMRGGDYHRILSKFISAYTEDPKVAMANLWYLRDIRNGAGERRSARIIYKYLVENHPEEINLAKMVEYGRWDDIMPLINSPLQSEVVDFIDKQLKKDLDSEHPSLMAKWLPSYRCHDRERHEQSLTLIARLFKCSKQYRKTLKHLRAKIGIVEQKISEKNYGEIEYSKVPSKAMITYSKAFKRNDVDRFCQYLNDVKQKKAKINTGTLTPVDIVGQYLGNYGFRAKPENDDVLNAAWDNLKNVFADVSENSLVMADTSGSMTCCNNSRPLATSLALALYISERNKGEFHNTFVTFSAKPELQIIKGDNLFDRINCIKTINPLNTNLEAAFDVILNVAVSKNLPQEEMPVRLYVISDMEFDEATETGTNFEVVKEKYEKAGYKLPQIIFWNVAARNDTIPVRFNQDGVALISGYSVNILETILKQEELSPYSIMMKTLEPYMG